MGINLHKKFILGILICAFVLPVPSTAHAYIGPGVGLTMIGSLIAFAVVGLTAFFGAVYYPLRSLFRKLRGKHDDQTDQTNESSIISEPANESEQRVERDTAR